MTRARLSWLALATVLTLSVHARAEAPDEAAQRGLGELRSLGCLACHTLDGNKQVGPTFQGLFGSTRRVTTGGVVREMIADESFVQRALAEPDVEVAEGYPAHAMPRFALEQRKLDDVMAALRHLSKGAPGKPAGSIMSLALSALLFVAMHLIMSAHPIRSRAVAKLGLPGFQGLYSLVVAALLGWMIYAWTRAPYLPLWPSPSWTRLVPLVGLPLIFVLMVAGFSTKSPTTAGQEAELEKADAAVGILRITRHPANVSNALWALVHLPPNGDVASLLLFGSIALLAIVGTLHIERRRRRSHGEAWEKYTRVTSIVPFAAIASGRNRLKLGEIGLWRVGLGLGVYAFALAAHTYAIGASPFPF